MLVCVWTASFCYIHLYVFAFLQVYLCNPWHLLTKVSFSSAMCQGQHYFLAVQQGGPTPSFYRRLFSAEAKLSSGLCLLMTNMLEFALWTCCIVCGCLWLPELSHFEATLCTVLALALVCSRTMQVSGAFRGSHPPPFYRSKFSAEAKLAFSLC